MHVDAEALAEHAARLANAGDGVQRVADRQRMQHGAPVAHRMAAGRRQHAADVAIGHRAAGKFDVGDEALAAETAAGQRNHDGFELHLGLAFGDIDGLAHHFLDLDQVDHAAGLHAARRGMGEAEHVHAVAAPAQHVLRRLRLEPRDHAGDLAGADIETGDHGGAPRRNRLHLGREAEAQHGHASLPFFLAFLSLLGRLERLVARRRGGIGLPHGDAVGKPQIDLHDVARQQLLVAVEIDQQRERVRRLALGQQHFDAAFQMQVPAPLGDQHRRRRPTWRSPDSA